MAPYTADMLIRDVLVSHPGATTVFERHKLGCASCLAAGMETLGSVAGMHGVPVEALISDLDRLEDPTGRDVADA
ncbi:MAG: DUF1858 domain-containing protein [Actinomycetota bacterium]|nr:DUF1858 domain-containing protein [Actinomycetota bacterium]